MTDNKNRSGSQSNPSGKNENRGDRYKTTQPGAPASSNKKNQQNDQSSSTEKTGGTKKGPNSI
jgi:hypothetical protein